MQIRCYRCGNSFTLSQTEISGALEAVQKAGGEHYDARCPRCRTTNKVPLAQLEKAAGPAGSAGKAP
jgi:phage FluMu protein Com